MSSIKKVFASLTILFICHYVMAEVKLPALLSNHMVLQQNAKVHIWGTASPGEDVTVSILGQRISTQTGKNGKWEVWLKPMKTAAPLEMAVMGKNTIIVKDILIGEVWIGSGQSNMELRVNQSNKAEQEIANSTNSKIRLFKVTHKTSDIPLEDVSGEWQVCGPRTIANFSATEYFFGRELYKATQLSLGLIQSCWSATLGESWVSKPALSTSPKLKYISEDRDSVLSKYNKDIEKWKADSSQNASKGILPPAKPTQVGGPEGINAPSCLYNGMIAPLAQYTIRGVLWYQGEANAHEKTAYPYRYLLQTLITDWRKVWKQGNFPFLVVQLSAIARHPCWPLLRESQAEALKLPNTSLIVTIDIGDSTTAHSKKKQELGLRLSLAARHLANKEDIEYSGPVYKRAKIKKDHIRIHFSHAKDMHSTEGEEIKGFELAGKDGKYIRANAKIDGQTIEVFSPYISNPVAVRYAWLDWPVCNLINGAGLPAAPFRTAHEE